jgi:dihydroorotate dehydrogenase
MDVYSRFLRPIFFSLDPEEAHDAVLAMLESASELSLGPGLIRLTAGKAVPPSPRTVAGITFPNPVGLAAGMDKNALALPAWEALGFGFAEIGTVTALPQPGNPKPRLFRYPQQQALINRFGFNNEGCEAVAARLEGLHASGRWPRIPVGINIGKSKVTPAEKAHEDYLVSYKRFHALGDYVVINVSSPNTPGLRDLQSTEALGKIIRTLRDWEGSSRRPLFVKVAPDLAEEDLIAIVRLAESEQLSGLIATNTTLDHSSIPAPEDQTGGLSGEPVRTRSLNALQIIRRQTKLPVIACGGISDAASARERFGAGADLLQIYTSFIYQGPGVLRTLSAAI